MVKYATNASGAMLLINLIQVTESISGSVVPLAMFVLKRGEIHVQFDYTGHGANVDVRYVSW